MLRAFAGGAPVGWDQDVAVRVARELAAQTSLTAEWEPGLDEEWVQLVGPAVVALVSKRQPFALVVGDDLARRFRAGHSERFSAFDLFLERPEPHITAGDGVALSRG